MGTRLVCSVIGMRKVISDGDFAIQLRIGITFLSTVAHKLARAMTDKDLCQVSFKLIHLPPNFLS